MIKGEVNILMAEITEDLIVQPVANCVAISLVNQGAASVSITTVGSVTLSQDQSINIQAPDGCQVKGENYSIVFDSEASSEDYKLVIIQQVLSTTDL